MLKEIIHDKEKYFQCSVYNFYYKTESLAKKCEDFCEKHNSCSLEITKHTVKISD